LKHSSIGRIKGKKNRPRCMDYEGIPRKGPGEKKNRSCDKKSKKKKNRVSSS